MSMHYLLIIKFCQESELSCLWVQTEDIFSWCSFNNDGVDHITIASRIRINCRDSINDSPDDVILGHIKGVRCLGEHWIVVVCVLYADL